MPVKDDVFLEAVKSVIIEKKIPSEVDIEVGKYMKEKLWYIYLDSMQESWAFKQIFAPALTHFVQDPGTFEKYVPEFGSYFQWFLPILLREFHSQDSPYPKIILPTKYPPPVMGSTVARKVVTVINPNLPISPKCASCLRVTGYSSIRSDARKWISTGIYAKQGELVTVTVPENVRGKFGLQVGTHTDQT